jgi:hypothetical protein
MAIEDSVSPALTVYVRRRRVLRFLAVDDRSETVREFDVVPDLLALEVAAGSSEDSRVAFTTV